MDIIDKVSSVANEQKWRAQYFKQVDGTVDSPSEIYPESVCSFLKWQVLFAEALHPKVAGSGDINIQDSYKAFHKMVKKAGYGVKEKTYLQSPTTADLTAGAAGEFSSGRGHGFAREEHGLRCAAG